MDVVNAVNAGAFYGQEKELVTDKDVGNAVYEGNIKRPCKRSDAKKYFYL